MIAMTIKEAEKVKDAMDRLMFGCNIVEKV